MIFSFTSVVAGLNSFTKLIFFEDWLIERKVDLTINEIKCRASIPSHANWFGARVRLGPNNDKKHGDKNKHNYQYDLK